MVKIRRGKEGEEIETKSLTRIEKEIETKGMTEQAEIKSHEEKGKDENEREKVVG